MMFTDVKMKVEAKLDCKRLTDGRNDRQTEEEGAREGPLLFALAVMAFIAIFDRLQQLPLEPFHFLCRRNLPIFKV